ncbi:ABC-2 family transporter protein [Haloimpatiens sp. FM7315]|uniref:ABC-2 family transporter protein n=1 Tax=Haloimpatiens sp. FM7315 TaxID=3298609 RepID=UPI00370B6009
MNTISKYVRLLGRYTKLSILDLKEFPFEIFMKSLSLGFDVVFVFLFWTSIHNLGISYEGWNKYEIFILAGCSTISDAIAQLTFGFRDIEYTVLKGNFDNYLMRPVNPIFSIMAEKFFIFWVVGEIIIGFLMILISATIGHLVIRNIFCAILIIVFSTFAFRFIYGTISLMCFWYGKCDSLRDIIFSIDIAKNYPMDIFGRFVFNIFIYVLPISMMATIPAKIMLNKEKHIYLLLTISILLFVFWIIIFHLVFKKALLKYQSTGS